MKNQTVKQVGQPFLILEKLGNASSSLCIFACPRFPVYTACSLCSRLKRYYSSFIVSMEEERYNKISGFPFDKGGVYVNRGKRKMLRGFLYKNCVRGLQGPDKSFLRKEKITLHLICFRSALYCYKRLQQFCMDIKSESVHVDTLTGLSDGT